MTRTSRFALLGSAIVASLAICLAAGAPANAAGSMTVQSVTVDQAQVRALTLQTITADVRGYSPVVQVAAPLAQFVVNVQIKSQAIEVAADCTSEGSGLWNCGVGNDLEPDGRITIVYGFRGLLAPGTYTVSASMGNNGVRYDGSGTVTIVGPTPSSGPASPPSPPAAAPTSPPANAGAPAKGGGPAKGGAPPAPGTTSPASPVGLTATATAPTAAITPSDPTGLQLPVAATVATRRPGHSGSATTVAVFAFVVAAAGVAASLFIRRLRRDRGLPSA